MLWTLAFTSPFIKSIIRTRIWSFLFYFFLVFPSILESGIITKKVWFSFLLALFLKDIKSCKSWIHWRVGSWRWQHWMAFKLFILLFRMFFNPVFVYSFILSYFSDLIMRIIVSSSWYSSRNIIIVFMIKFFLSDRYLFLFELSNSCILLFLRFLQTICSNSWFFTLLLF